MLTIDNEREAITIPVCRGLGCDGCTRGALVRAATLLLVRYNGNVAKETAAWQGCDTKQQHRGTKQGEHTLARAAIHTQQLTHSHSPFTTQAAMNNPLEETNWPVQV